MTRSPAGATPWLPMTRPGGDGRARVFCFPYSGGSASVFAAWRDVLGPAVEVCPVELPGRGRRMHEPAFTAMEPLVEAASAALLPWLDRPFAVFGHSLGALVGFEVARRITREHGISPLHLFASGHVAPQVAQRDEPLHDLPEPRFVERLRALNGTPAEVLDNAELRAIILPILRADFAICDAYAFAPGAPLSCGISAYGGLQDAEVPRAELDAWREQTSGAFALRMFPGDHFFLNSARQTVLWALGSDLQRLLERRSPAA